VTKMIMYFNLKNGVSEEEFVSRARELFRYLEGKVEGLGAAKLYRHDGFGANPRMFQIHMEMRDFATLDRLSALIYKDAVGGKLFQENWWKLIDMDTHYDEFVREIPL